MSDEQTAQHPHSDCVATLSGTPLIDVKGLQISFRTSSGMLNVVPDLSFSMAPGEKLAIVGESGCGKTITGLAILGLLSRRQADISGEIRFDGQNLLSLTERRIQGIRAPHLCMVFQEPMIALDPVFTIASQISARVRQHFNVVHKAERQHAVEILNIVG